MHELEEALRDAGDHNIDLKVVMTSTHSWRDGVWMGGVIWKVQLSDGRVFSSSSDKDADLLRAVYKATAYVLAERERKQITELSVKERQLPLF